MTRLTTAEPQSQTRSRTRRTEFLTGAKDTIPLVLGAIPFAIIFGAVAGSSGLSAGGTVAMSVFVFAGSAQFIATNLIASNTPGAVIILTTFVVNLRHALYSATLAPHVKRLPQRWLIPLAFWLTDESFMIVISHYNKPDASPFKHWYFLGSELIMYSNWVAFTGVGVLAGKVIGENSGLDFAMVATFIGLVVPFVKSRAARVSVLCAGVSSIFTYSMPNKLGLIVAALLGIVAGMVVETFWPEPIEPIELNAALPVTDPLLQKESEVG
ncbi:MAG: AzlC family ABC transporter permease [Chloroflexota bacterium]